MNEQPIAIITPKVALKDYKYYTLKFHLLPRLMIYPGVLLGSTIAPLFFGPNRRISVPAFVIPTLVCLLFVFIHTLFFLLRIKKRYAESSEFHWATVTAEFHEEHIIEHVQSQHRSSTTQVCYSNFPRAIETRHAFLLARDNSRQNHVIYPKSCIADDQVIALRELFARKFGKKFVGGKRA